MLLGFSHNLMVFQKSEAQNEVLCFIILIITLKADEGAVQVAKDQQPQPLRRRRPPSQVKLLFFPQTWVFLPKNERRRRQCGAAVLRPTSTATWLPLFAWPPSPEGPSSGTRLNPECAERVWPDGTGAGEPMFASCRSESLFPAARLPATLGDAIHTHTGHGALGGPEIGLPLSHGFHHLQGRTDVCSDPKWTVEI